MGATEPGERYPEFLIRRERALFDEISGRSGAAIYTQYPWKVEESRARESKMRKKKPRSGFLFFLFSTSLGYYTYRRARARGSILHSRARNDTLIAPIITVRVAFPAPTAKLAVASARRIGEKITTRVLAEIGETERKLIVRPGCQAPPPRDAPQMLTLPLPPVPLREEEGRRARNPGR